MRISPSIFLIFSFFILIGSASAESFSDDFNTGFGIGWTNDGNWGTGSASPTVDGTQYIATYPAAGVGYYLRRTPLTGAANYSFDVYLEGTGAASINELEVSFDKNTTSSNRLVFKKSAGSYVVALLENGTYSSSFSNTSIAAGTWYGISLTKNFVTHSLYVSIIRKSDSALMGASQITMTRWMESPTTFEFQALGATPSVGLLKIDNFYTETANPTYGIWTDQSVYAVNDVVDINYNIEQSFWSFLYTYRIRALNVNDDSVIQTFDGISQEGVYNIQFTSKGDYRFEVQKSSMWGFLFGYDVVYESLVYIGVYDSYIFVPSEVSSGVHQNVSVRYGFDADPSVANLIRVFNYDGSDWVKEDSYYMNTYCGGTCELNTLYTVPVIFHKEGLYRLDLTAHNKGVVASVTTESVWNGNIIQVDLSNSFIETDKTLYFPGQDADVSYGIDNDNFTNYRIYLEFYNYNKTTSLDKVLVTKQLSKDFYYFKLDRIFSNDFLVMPGLSKWSINSYDSDDNFVAELAYTNITVSKTDIDGYGMFSDKQEYCNDEVAKITLYMPSPSTVGVGEPGGTTKTLNFSSSSVYSWSTQRKVGIYAWLLYSDVNTLRSTIFTEIKSCDSGVTETTTPGVNPFEEPTNLFLSTYFIPFLMLFLFAGMGFYYGGGIGGIVGFAGGFIFASAFGLIPVWALFLFAIVAIVLFATILSKNLTGGSE